MLIRRKLTWAAVILALALGITVALRTRDDREGVETPIGTARAEQEPSWHALSPPRARRRALSEEPEAERVVPADEEPRLTSDEPPETGWVRGIVFEADGTPMAGSDVVLHRSSPEWGPRATVTDAAGEFLLDEIPVGSWELRHETRRPPVFEAMVGRVLPVDVLANQETWVPVQLDGDRSLTGRLTMDVTEFKHEAVEQGGLMVQLELRPRWKPGVISARATLHAFNIPPWERPPSMKMSPEEILSDITDPSALDGIDLGDPDSWPIEEGPELIAGAFRFEHLEPGQYVLRVSLENNEWVTTRIDGESLQLQVYLEREVDLTHGDVELPHEELDFWKDFIRESYERHLQNAPESLTTEEDEP